MEKIRRDVAVILLRNKEGKYLFQLREGSRFPNHWGFFGGGIEKKETPKETVIREVKEELHYQLKNPEFIYKERKQFPNPEQTIEFDVEFHIFFEEFDNAQTLQQEEGTDMKWMDLAEAKTKKWIPGDVNRFEKCLRIINSKT